MSRISKTKRQTVRERANSRCEYCLVPETVTHFAHQVDHIIPPRHGGSDKLNNLAWTCFRCNNNKGTDIATIDPVTNQLVRFFDPRSQQWDDHFEIDDMGFIHGKTPVGEATVRIFGMNAAQRVEMRRLLIEAGLW